jgi:transposase
MILTREKIFFVKHYFRNESYALCQEAFQEAFSDDTVSNKTIYRIITKFEETGSVCGRTHNRRHTFLNDDTLEDVRLRLLFCSITVLLRGETSVAFYK